MSPTSYQTAPPRELIITIALFAVKLAPDKADVKLLLKKVTSVDVMGHRVAVKDNGLSNHDNSRGRSEPAPRERERESRGCIDG
jgi:hypothetical protein